MESGRSREEYKKKTKCDEGRDKENRKGSANTYISDFSHYAPRKRGKVGDGTISAEIGDPKSIAGFPQLLVEDRRSTAIPINLSCKFDFEHQRLVRFTLGIGRGGTNGEVGPEASTYITPAKSSAILPGGYR
jgi:hypothetical protein